MVKPSKAGAGRLRPDIQPARSPKCLSASISRTAWMSTNLWRSDRPHCSSVCPPIANSAPFVEARIKEPRRTVEVACLLRYCLFATTDQAILMILRQMADLWLHAGANLTETANWAAFYKNFLTNVTSGCKLTQGGAFRDRTGRATAGRLGRVQEGRQVAVRLLRDAGLQPRQLRRVRQRHESANARDLS
jgi:hypothetical protein